MTYVGLEGDQLSSNDGYSV